MQRRDNDRQRSFTRRALILAGAQAGLMGGLAARMYYLQVVEADRYALLADENRINMRLLQPSRGAIVDRFGVPLAINRKNYRVLITAENTSDIEQTLDLLGQIIPIGDEERARILREAHKRRNFVPVTVREFLEWEEVAKIEVNAPDLPGISIDVGQRRFYPDGITNAHVLGYVAAVSPDDINGDPLLETPGFRIGRSGLERRYDLALRGRAGASQVEVNAVGRIIRELDRKEGQSGEELVLTLDFELQRYAAELLGEESGAVVLIDVRTGALLTLMSTPSFDPHAFTEGLSTSQWQALVNNERSPLRNKAIAGEFSPGSTFKMVVALAALEAGVVDTETSFFCSGKIRLGDGLFHCWKRQGHGHVELIRGLRESCDVFFYETARRVGIERISEMGRRLGLGSAFDIDLPGERAGLMPTPAWKQAVIGEPWVTGETLVAGIGQGFVLTTPLQLAVMVGRIANGKKALHPYITRDIAVDDALAARKTEELPDLGINLRHLEIVRQGMIEVMMHERGTARRSRIGIEGMEMAGKTGTAQVRRISRRERQNRVLKNEELPWRSRDHALFLGFAPLDNPRYAVAVVVEHGGGGSKVAAPIARDILRMAQLRDPSAYKPGTTSADQIPSGTVDS
ncbi:MAG: penicillin-binding protein 2 [Alphaproteobacteria bacterium]